MSRREQTGLAGEMVHTRGAMVHFRHALASKPEYARVHLNLGTAHFLEGRLVAAVRSPGRGAGTRQSRFFAESQSGAAQTGRAANAASNRGAAAMTGYRPLT